VKKSECATISAWFIAGMENWSEIIAVNIWRFQTSYYLMIYDATLAVGEVQFKPTASLGFRIVLSFHALLKTCNLQAVQNQL